MKWIDNDVVAFDLETTGTDIENDRVVTAALIRLQPDGRMVWERSWLVDPGVPIPAEAAAIHGVTTERARQGGAAAPGAIEAITQEVAEGLLGGVPLVVMNARFDLTLLDRECRRHGVPALTDRLGHEPAPVVDPLILDKYVDRYRRGKRTLQALCEYYAVTFNSAHQAGEDAFAAARVALRVGEKYPEIGGKTAAALHDLQVRAAAAQAASFQQYLRRTANPQAYVEPAWPLVPFNVQQARR